MPGRFAAGEALDLLAPGPVLAGFAADACDSGLARLSDDELVGLLCAARRLSSWQASMEFAAVCELDARRRRAAARPESSRLGDHISAELAAALTLTARSADSLLGLARCLARIPVVLRALAAGLIDRGRAEVFATELSALSDVAAAAIAAAFCGPAAAMTTGQLRAALRSMVLMIDPDAARRRAERGRADSRVETWQEGTGNAALAGRELPAAEVVAADKRIAAIARALKQAGASGSMDQLRAAVFSALLTGRDPQDLLPEPPIDQAPAGSPQCPSRDQPDTSRPSASQADAASARYGDQPGRGLAALTGSVNLTMPLSAWLGQSDAPGEAAGLGPLDADTCRDLAGRLAAGRDTHWCMTLTGPDGRALAHACARGSPGAGGTSPSATASEPARWLATLDFNWLERGSCTHQRQTRAYRPGDTLRKLVKVRQRTCAFPGCRRPATACDDDHTIAYEQGGRTCECNLAPPR
ncbi:MAG TPA: hypothetical protein VNF47_27530 [Streptosporangiaceae bacterium]|nr:hypothetical protein [Streptosporangiaceae bacterium]